MNVSRTKASATKVPPGHAAAKASRPGDIFPLSASALGLLVAGLALSFLAPAGQPRAAEPSLRFVAIGDTPYSRAEEERLEGEIAEAIAAAEVPFVVHHGDFKGGGEACTEELLRQRRDQIDRLHPGRVFYTPGDNEWTDCDRPELDPAVSELASLDFLRRLFFAEPLPLGEEWAYARQPLFPENARWMHGGVAFATVHHVSTNDGRQEILKDDVEEALALVEARGHANRVWLAAVFETAEDVGASAVVVVTQADVTDPDGAGPCTAFDRMDCDAFAAFRGDLARHAAGFRERGEPRKPVLLIHGDTNPYCLDKGFGGARAPNLWRLNAWGDYREPADATLVTVEPQDTEQPFKARTLVGGEVPREGCE